MRVSIFLLAALLLQDLEKDYDRHARRAVPRDGFPVLNNPPMTSVREADRTGAVRPDDPVIGIRIQDESKAYPLVVMGSHELANDTCGGEPIAVSW